jgi:hypothetical protein
MLCFVLRVLGSGLLCVMGVRVLCLADALPG